LIVRFFLTFVFLHWYCIGNGQLVDTIKERCVTIKQHVNAGVSIMSPMKVKILKPEIINRKGYKIQNGYTTYYLHIIKSKQIELKVILPKEDTILEFDPNLYTLSDSAIELHKSTIQYAYMDSAKLANRERPTYLAICSTKKKIKSKDFESTLESPIVFLKGMIDNTDSLIKYYKKIRKVSASKEDSLEIEFKSTSFDDEKERKRLYAEWVASQNKVEEDKWYLNLYQDFRKAKRTKRSKGLLKFFMSKYFAVSLKYTILSNPYGLPKFPYEDPAKPKQMEPQQDKHKVKGSKKKKKKK